MCRFFIIHSPTCVVYFFPITLDFTDVKNISADRFFSRLCEVIGIINLIFKIGDVIVRECRIVDENTR